jgi:hypothetical protein
VIQTAERRNNGDRQATTLVQIGVDATCHRSA